MPLSLIVGPGPLWFHVTLGKTKAKKTVWTLDQWSFGQVYHMIWWYDMWWYVMIINADPDALIMNHECLNLNLDNSLLSLLSFIHTFHAETSNRGSDIGVMIGPSAIFVFVFAILFFLRLAKRPLRNPWHRDNDNANSQTLATPVQRDWEGLLGLLERNRCWYSVPTWSLMAKWMCGSFSVFFNAASSM